MKTEWDYSDLANAYLKRPDYSQTAVDAMLTLVGAKGNFNACDIGAGVAHLTLMLAEHGMQVTAVEPNDAMRSNGEKRTRGYSNVTWFEGTGEHTGQSADTYDLVTFGSSFNVCDRSLALQETSRILKPGGWFACMWNHRDLHDPVQQKIEEIIKVFVPEYGYGSRREDQTSVIEASKLFGPAVHVDAMVYHETSVLECIEAWRSHATLQRQSKGTFGTIVDEIGEYLSSLNTPTITIPYSTNVWISQVL